MSITKFRFRLEPVLQRRADQAAAAEQALALAHNRYNQLLIILNDTRQRLEKTFQSGDLKKLDLFMSRQFSFYRMSLNKKIIKQKKDLNEAARLVENKRNEAVRARQEQQVLEKLKEHGLNNFKREMALREQKEIDEMSLATYQRRDKSL
ncbi:MAG: flagellar export protein FliJ [Peptococcaceae bacterium]|nr:flagellar export protein FliJ [Peptococcaceae bacterium]